jgi:hypothetical protein
VVARTCTWFCGALPQYIPVRRTVLQLLALQHIRAAPHIRALHIRAPRMQVLRIQSHIRALHIRAPRIQSHIRALRIQALRIQSHIRAPRMQALRIQAPRMQVLRTQSHIRALHIQALHIQALHIQALRGIRLSHNIRNIPHLRDCHLTEQKRNSVLSQALGQARHSLY